MKSSKSAVGTPQRRVGTRTNSDPTEYMPESVKADYANARRIHAKMRKIALTDYDWNKQEDDDDNK